MAHLQSPTPAGTTSPVERKREQADGPAGWSALGKLTSPRTTAWVIASETLMLPLIIIAIGLWANPSDFLFIDSSYPWVWFGPMILALRYGPLTGIAGSAVVVAAWIISTSGAAQAVEFPKLFFLGGLIQVMLIGEFSSLWLARTRRAETLQHYLDQRLHVLTHQYYLLRLSHDRLEQDLIGKPMAMRDAISILQRSIHSKGRDDDAEGARNLLRLLAQYCQIEVASLNSISNEIVSPSPLASLGGVEAIDVDDPLIVHAMENRKLAHAADTLHDAKQKSRYLIAAPLLNINDEMFGMLVVDKMPFVVLNDETLQAINLLLGYYADGLSTQAIGEHICKAVPDCPPGFAFEMERMWHISRESRVSSVVVALKFPEGTIAEEIADQLRQQKRSLDENWMMVGHVHPTLVTLMPLCGKSAAEGYLARIEAWLSRKHRTTIADAGIDAYYFMLDGGDPIAILNEIVKVADAA